MVSGGQGRGVAKDEGSDVDEEDSLPRRGAEPVAASAMMSASSSSGQAAEPGVSSSQAQALHQEFVDDAILPETERTTPRRRQERPSPSRESPTRRGGKHDHRSLDSSRTRGTYKAKSRSRGDPLSLSSEDDDALTYEYGGDDPAASSVEEDGHNPDSSLFDPDDDDENDSSSLQTDVTDSDWGDDHPQHRRLNNNNHPQQDVLLSEADIEICQRLDQEYELALEERDIAYTARYRSVRQSACVSVVFMGLFLTLANVFFARQADWSLGDSLLFSVYTITTVGYGHLEHPETPAFQVYTMFFILTGISLLTIMVAQVYQCLALEASRAQHSRDSRLFVDAVFRPPQTDTTASATAGQEASPLPPPGQGSDPAAAMSTSVPSTHANGTHSNAVDSEHIDEVEAGTSAPIPQPSATASAPSSPMAPLPPSSTSSYGYRVASSLPYGPQTWEIIQSNAHWVDFVWFAFDKCRHFFYETEFGRSVSVLFPFLGLIVVGATVIGSIEGWTVVESLYFAIVSLTTVGYGDYYPTRSASIVFCILWLPFSVGFMSLFLANVAAFYIRLSDRNIARMERQLRRHVARAKADAERELSDARRRALRGQEYRNVVEGSRRGGDGDSGGNHKEDAAGSIKVPTSRRDRANKRQGFDTVPTDDDVHSDGEGDDNEDSTSHRDDDGYDQDAEAGGIERRSDHRRKRTSALFGSRSASNNRRDAILRNCRKAWKFTRGNKRAKDRTRGSVGSVSSDDSVTRPRHATMTTMRDVLRTVRRQMTKGGFRGAGPESEFLSIRSSRMVRNRLETDSQTPRKPSFALRSLVQERFSEIIAAEVAGYSSSIEIHDNTLTVTIDSLRHTADKWLIPRRARKAFRSVCFEALFFVGEHGLVVRGANALFDLSPIEFHGLFAPLLAAMGDAETMEGWLASTQILADFDLKKDGHEHGNQVGVESRPRRGSTALHREAERPPPAQHTVRPTSRLTTPGNAFAAAKNSMQYA